MKKYKKQPWTVEERRILSEYYFTLNLEDMAFMLPNRTEQAIKNQVTYLRKRGYRFKNGNKWYYSNYTDGYLSLVVSGERRVMTIFVRNGNVDQALRKFKRKITDSNKLFDYREKEYFEKPSQKRKRKKQSAVMRERKRQEKYLKERK